MNMDIANKLIENRKKVGLSQEELADKLKVSRQAVSKWECGESLPDTENLIALSKLYGMSIDNLVGNTAAEENAADSGEATSVNPHAKWDDDYGMTAKQRRVAGLIGGVTALACVALYFTMGFCFDFFEYAWLVFLCIPTAVAIYKIVIRHKIWDSFGTILIMFILIAFFTVNFATGWAYAEWSWLVFLAIPVYYIVAELFNIRKQ
jgi:transcriptional regulator with XRE-family HTH domain